MFYGNNAHVILSLCTSITAVWQRFTMTNEMVKDGVFIFLYLTTLYKYGRWYMCCV